jgi:hypothetical protein
VDDSGTGLGRLGKIYPWPTGDLEITLLPT